MRFILFALAALGAVALPTTSEDAAAPALEDIVVARSGVPPMAHAGLALAANEPHPPPRNMTTEALIGPHAKHPYDGMEIHEQTTDSGKKYRVIRPKGSAAKEARALARQKRCLTCKHFTASMTWIAGGYGVTTTSFREKTGLQQWNIDNYGGFIYQNRLNFRTGESNNYMFRDGEGDWYSCNVYNIGTHYIDYNSGNPSMYEVQGV